MGNFNICQACRRMAPVRYCEFTQGIGMLVVRTRRGVRGNMCRDCASKYFWEMTGLTLLTGWWGMISFVMNIVYIISNTGHFIGSRRLAAPAGGAFPIQVSPGSVTPPQRGAGNDGMEKYRLSIAAALQSGQSQQEVTERFAAQSGLTRDVAQAVVREIAEGGA